MAALNTNIKDTAQGLRVYVLNVHKTHCFTEHLVAVRPAEALRGDTGDSGIREGAWLLNVCVCVRTRTLLLSHSAMPDSLQPKDSGPPASPVHGIFQPRILEWAATSTYLTILSHRIK